MDRNSRKNLPKVSVVMPAFNAEATIGEAIESILNQTYENFEFIIVDDGSIDKTGDIIRSYKELDNRIKLLINENNKGCYPSRNIGMANSTGEYIAVMDADDISLPDRLIIEIKKFEENHNLLVLGGGVYWVDGKERKYLEAPSGPYSIQWNLLTKQTGMHHPTMMFRRKEVFDKFGNYPEKYAASQDRAFLLKISSLSPNVLMNVNKAMLEYRRTESSIGEIRRNKKIKQESNIHYLIPYIRKIVGVDLLKEEFLTIAYDKFFSGKISFSALRKLNNLHNFFLEKTDISTSDLNYISNNYFKLRNRIVKKMINGVLGK